MKRFFFYACLIAAVCLTISSGLLYGKLSNRWGHSREMLSVAERLESFPADFGDWKLRDSEKMSDIEVEMLQCAGYVNRTYFNAKTAEVVSVAVLLGPHGPISVHTPEVCYSSRNYRIVEKDKVATVREAGGRETTFWSTTFESTGLEGGFLRVYHAWTFNGDWNASEQPRISYLGKPYLLKIQLATTLPPDAEPGEDDACTNFLREFIPALNKHLFEPGS